MRGGLECRHESTEIAGAATAAVIVVLALLLIIGIPSGFLTSEIPGPGRTRSRISADDIRRDQNRPVAKAQRDADPTSRWRTRKTPRLPIA